MPSKSVLIAQAFSKTGVLSTVVDSAPSVNTGQVDVATSADLPNTGNDVGDQAFVQETNRLYIWSGSGWYNIALINTTPTWDSNGQPESSYVLDVDSPQDATVITLAASDPEGIPITYEYITSGQMDSIATVSQDSSVFTITPKTEAQVPDGGTGSITFRASDGVNILPQVSSFTLNFSTSIANTKYNTLLVTVTDTSDNNNITDASVNNHLITVNGDAHAGTFSPYRSGGYSTYFDGSGDYLTATGTAIGTGDFTLEAWIYTASFSNYRTIFTNRGSSNSTGNFVLGVDSAAQVYLYSNNFLITSSSTLSANTWHHVALVRNGTGSGSTVLYIDGSSVGSADVSNNFSDTAYDIGGDTVDSYHWNGYISDLRVNIGTAIYISAFTPPTKRLTAITNTSLLTCHLPYIADGSTNNYSITVNGNVTTKPYSPYDYDEYDADVHGGSVYFDDTFDSLQLPGNINLGGDFTVSAWIYMQGTSKAVILGSTYPPNYQFFIDSSNVIGFHDNTTTVNGTGIVQRDKWNYCVWSRSGSNISMYVNGESRGTGTSSATFQMRYVSSLGNQYDFFNGYISDLQIKTTSTSAANAVPPTAPLSSSGTSLHIKGTDASIIDKSQVSNLKLVGNTTGSTTQVKFANTKSMYFDGSGDYIDTNKNLQGDFGTGDFTVEGWFYLNEAIGAVRVLLGSGTGDGNDEFMLVLESNGKLTYDWFSVSDYIQSTSTITAYTWHHIALTRSGTQLDLWLDGTSVASNSSHSYNYNGTSTFKIGMSRAGAFFWNGYIQDVRITNGLARYTANFTPPTASLEG
jgi:hypothetical protein